MKEQSEISIILPALNEEKTIKNAVNKIKKVLNYDNISYEIIVVDNASEDNTAKIAKENGAKVVFQPNRGYGNAIRKGFEAAKGKYIIMFDPDGSYDLNTIKKMVTYLRKGHGYVNANRFASLEKDSMNFKHRFGNKLINMFGNIFFGTRGNDMLSGFKGFSKEALQKMNLQAPRWDLNVEIQSKLNPYKIKYTEIPTRYYARGGESKLSGFNAGWYNLRFMLLYSPNPLIFYPSAIFLIIGILGMLTVFLTNLLQAVALIFSSLIFFSGLQLSLFGIISKNFLAKRQNRESGLFVKSLSNITLGKSIVFSGIVFSGSLIIFLIILLKWLHQNVLSLSDIKLSILAFTIFLSSISFVMFSFMNEQINEQMVN